MKVVHVEAGRHLYGGALQVVFLLEGLQARGIESVLVCPPGAEVGRRARELGIDVREMPLRGDHDLPFILRLVRLLRRERPDILHLHSRRGADTLGGIAGRLAGVPTVLSRRVDNPEPRWLVAVKYRLYDRVIVISEAIRRVLVAGRVPTEKVHCVHSAVDTDRYTPRRDREWFEGEFDLPPNAMTIGMIAQMIPRKGHFAVLEVAPEILRERPHTYFLFFGKGPLKQAIEKRIATTGLQGQIRLCGFRSDIERVIPNLDILVHPASMEGLGVTILQASACGVPVVASGSGGIPEAIENGSTGVILSSPLEDHLADALITLLDAPQERQRMGEAGRRKVQRSFSTSAMVAGNIAVYREISSRYGNA